MPLRFGISRVVKRISPITFPLSRRWNAGGEYGSAPSLDGGQPSPAPSMSRRDGRQGGMRLLLRGPAELPRAGKPRLTSGRGPQRLVH